ncbi:MAG: DUF615 domain-containing protein [Candidatus Eisenbacteria bacterium]|uniref:DUF615 domain-containing protein n=1 Tax=Eiseniibacteriota bacterium TaxID=2212470 RepID=A0A956RQM0_UNCEI|nr:DUF615 domain-containing protein [Candidatus Eisenbacteria bacterium]
MESIPKSRAQRRRDDQPRHDLAGKLVQVPVPKLARLPLDDELRDAVTFAAARTEHGARRRAIRHLATVLRTLDEDSFVALEQAVDSLGTNGGAVVTPVGTAGAGASSGVTPGLLVGEDSSLGADPAVEGWIANLLADEAGTLTRARESFPAVDLTRLRQLVRNWRREAQANEVLRSAAAKSATAAAPGRSPEAGGPESVAKTKPNLKPKHRARTRLIGYLNELMSMDHRGRGE